MLPKLKATDSRSGGGAAPATAPAAAASGGGAGNTKWGTKLGKIIQVPGEKAPVNKYLVD
jgi:hypothetical protein